MNFWEDFMIPAIAIFALLVGVVFLIVGGLYGIDYAYNRLMVKPACENFAIQSGQPTSWSYATGCMVKKDGEWLNWSTATGNRYELKQVQP
jgi:hypothetical protein